MIVNVNNKVIDIFIKMSISSLLDSSILSLLTIKLTFYKSNISITLNINISISLSSKYLKRRLEKCYLKFN